MMTGRNIFSSKILKIRTESKVTKIFFNLPVIHLLLDYMQKISFFSVFDVDYKTKHEQRFSLNRVFQQWPQFSPNLACKKNKNYFRLHY